MVGVSQRGLNIVLVFGCRVVTQTGRFAWSFLILQMAHEFSWTVPEQGSIKAAYAGGYLLTQIPGGLGGARLGNKIFQTISVLSSALGLLLVPVLLHRLDSIPGAPSSAVGAQLVLFITGMCCGAQMPTGTALCKAWTLPTENSWTSSISSIASVLSSLFNALVVAALAEAIGWRATMLTLSATTFIYLVAVTILVHETPASMGAALPEGEASLFRRANMIKSNDIQDQRARPDQSQGTTPQKKRGGRSPSPAKAALGASSSLRKLFAQPATWALFLGHATWNAVRYTLDQEMPKYYVERLKAPTTVAGFHMASLHIASFVLLVSTKDIFDNLISSGSLTTLRLRQLSISGGYGTVFAGALALAYLSALQVGNADASGMIATVPPLSLPPPILCTLALHVIWLGLTMQTFGHTGNYFDLTAHNTGVLMGVGNTIATIPSYVGPLLCAHALDIYGEQQGWGMIFNGLGAVAIIAGLVYASAVRVEPLDVLAKQKGI